MEWFSLFINTALLMGACDPYGLHREKKQVYINQIIKQAELQQQDPYELLAIAITESSLNPKAYSRTKDVGLFQVNCRWWYKKFKYDNIKQCEVSLMDPELNISKGIYILTHFRNNYKQCKGEFAYRCYNGGQGWPRSRNKHKIVNYGNKVRQRKKILHKYYKEMIEKVRLHFKTRS